jgi:hypothetical protein
VRARERDRVERLGECPDLVDLDQDRVRYPLLDAPVEALDVGDEEIVSDQLDTIAEPLRELLPARPVVFGRAVFDRNDGIPLREVRPVIGELVGRQFSTLEGIPAVVPNQLRHRGVEGDRDPVAVTGSLGRSHDQIERGLAGGQVRREAALVADRGHEPLLLEQRLQGVKGLDGDAETVAEPIRAAGNDHELLEVERILRVRPAVDHVQHRHGQHMCLGTADPPVERHPSLGGGRLGRRQRHPEHGVGSQAGLVLRAVEGHEGSVDRALICSVEAGQRRSDLLTNVANRVLNAFAEVRLGVAVT